MKRIRSLWTQFRAIPAIIQLGLWLLVAMLAILLFAPGPARADAVYRDPSGDVLRIVDQPCPPDIAVRAQPGARGYYKFGTARLHGKVWRVCAMPGRIAGRQGIQVHVIYEDGDQSALPYSDFVDEEPVPVPAI